MNPPWNTLDRFMQKHRDEEVDETKLREITYTRKFNIGNYESEEIGVVAELEGLENITDTFRELKQTVFALQAEGQKAEPPPVTQQPNNKVPWSFDPNEFLSHEWKGKRKDDGTYEKGSLSWGWDFTYKDREHQQPNFSEASLKVLENGPIDIGDDYTVKLNETGTLVHIQKQKRKA